LGWKEIAMIVSAQAEQAPLVQRLLVAASGSLITTVVGTVGFGFFLWWLTNRATAQRAADERKRDEISQAAQIKHDLLAATAEVSATFYLAVQAYWRKIKKEQLKEEDKDQARREVEEQYRDSRKGFIVLEARLEAYFESDKPRETWHKMDDLLTVRYFQLKDQATDELLERNAKGYEGKEHSGLTVEELRDRIAKGTLLSEYHEVRKKLPAILMSAKLREPDSAASSQS
jgi:hypothetical protein